MSDNQTIVVGYDGSAGAGLALRWALSEGRLRDMPVRVVQVVEWPVNVPPGEAGWLTVQQRNAAKEELDLAIEEAGGGAAEASIVEGSIVGTLCAMSHESAILVLGARGAGGFAGLLLGSVAQPVSVHAACPVVIVRGEDMQSGRLPILLGFDESAHSENAARFAFAEARARRVDVLVLKAWWPGADPLGEVDSAERYAIRQALASVRDVFPEVKYSVHLVVGEAAQALINFSREAQLVVTGHRGRGGFKGLLMGSVAHKLINHAHCPVAVVR